MMVNNGWYQFLQKILYYQKALRNIWQTLFHNLIKCIKMLPK